MEENGSTYLSPLCVVASSSKLAYLSMLGMMTPAEMHGCASHSAFLSLKISFLVPEEVRLYAGLRICLNQTKKLFTARRKG